MYHNILHLFELVTDRVRTFPRVMIIRDSLVMAVRQSRDFLTIQKQER
jgi:hypothetical protein